MYCVIWQDGWRIALLTGKHKDVMPGTFRSVRAACAECGRLNAAYEATGRPTSPDSAENR